LDWLSASQSCRHISIRHLRRSCRAPANNRRPDFSGMPVFGPVFMVQSYHWRCRSFKSTIAPGPNFTPATSSVGVRVPAWSHGPMTRKCLARACGEALARWFR
jgi:hypothetical protein